MSAHTRATYVPAAINACLASYELDLREITAATVKSWRHNDDLSAGTVLLFRLATDCAADELARLERFRVAR
jgi:hypothetical protein